MDVLIDSPIVKNTTTSNGELYQSVIDYPNGDEKYIIVKVTWEVDGDDDDDDDESYVINDDDSDDDYDDGYDDDRDTKKKPQQPQQPQQQAAVPPPESLKIFNTLKNDALQMQTRYVLVSTDLEYHSDIYNWYKKKLYALCAQYNRAAAASTSSKYNCSTKCLGGGIITIDTKNKTIKTYGQSMGFGPPKMDLLENIINSIYTNNSWKTSITITDYIRG
ncbi:hypothetical protein DFA_01616 [Cavenderia fasciculata]|uniref:Uncharacterized protein n=1 Tax=Cavenderia fasciculata TaxID=261658 RepID=F4PTR0_CACFS|nr:uncharacterized protein DFA_01616 [Cavenderia fasciculata]EGG21730.1 hypothetical protein DFA_01616 [Cavenderia fasciculata]|eukprot:XP_004359580.1 hypothetical protein DFA_01616 [Cavenderia fasciculata]